MKTFLGITKGCWCGSSAVKQNINEVKQSENQAAGGAKSLVKKIKLPRFIKHSLTRLA